MSERQTKKCKHTRAPDSYLAWHEWADIKGKTHLQTRCPECGLYAVWIPKPPDWKPPSSQQGEVK